MHLDAQGRRRFRPIIGGGGRTGESGLVLQAVGVLVSKRQYLRALGIAGGAHAGADGGEELAGAHRAVVVGIGAMHLPQGAQQAVREGTVRPAVQGARRVGLVNRHLLLARRRQGGEMPVGIGLNGLGRGVEGRVFQPGGECAIDRCGCRCMQGARGVLRVATVDEDQAAHLLVVHDLQARAQVAGADDQRGELCRLAAGGGEIRRHEGT